MVREGRFGKAILLSYGDTSFFRSRSDRPDVKDDTVKDNVVGPAGHHFADLEAPDQIASQVGGDGQVVDLDPVQPYLRRAGSAVNGEMELKCMPAAADRGGTGYRRRRNVIPHGKLAGGVDEEIGNRGVG